MALPVRPVTNPSVLAGQPNGRLPTSLLTTIAMPGGGTAVVLAAIAPKWEALLADAGAAGFRFAQEGDYRTYDEQVRLFDGDTYPSTGRYTKTVLKGRPTKVWQGRTWYQKPNTAVAATPGSSNHGWGLALDLVLVVGGKRISLASTAAAAALAWLIANAHLYAVSAEIQSEAWHWRPYDGDAKTAAVIAFEEENMALEKEIVPQTGDRNVLVVLSDLFNHLMSGHSGYVPKDVAFTPARLNEILAAVKELEARPAVEVDAAAVAAALEAAVEAAVGARFAALEAKVDRLIAGEQAQAAAVEG